MKELKKPRADSKLKNLPDLIQEGFWLLLHPSDAETPAYTLEDLGGEVFDKHGISVAVSTLSEWRAWYSLKRRMEAAAERADQARLELAKDPNITPADIERVAQTVFTAESLQAGDVESYVRLAKLNLARTKQALDRDKLSAASKTQIEKGLDALFEEIKGNKKAEAIFSQLQEVVKKA